MTQDNREFQVRLLGWKEIHELPGGWTPARFLALLALMDVEGVSANDAAEMVAMALQDLPPEQAADKVLEVVFGEALKRGARENMAHDLEGDHPWEEAADLSHQARIFNAMVILQRAFPRHFARPDAVSISVAIETNSETAKGWLAAPDAGLLARILAAGMDDRATLRRLFGDALAGPRFPEASAILWDVSGGPEGFEIISSHRWFGPLERAHEWVARAKPDLPVPTDA